MRKLLRSKLILSTAIAGIVAIPAAFAHGHHGNSTYAVASGRHGGFTHNSFASADNRANARNGAQSSNDNDHDQVSAEAIASNSHKHGHVPDEEELAQPEQ